MKETIKEFNDYIHPEEAIEYLAEMFDIYWRNVGREYDLTHEEEIEHIGRKGYFLLRMAELIVTFGHRE